MLGFVVLSQIRWEHDGIFLLAKQQESGEYWGKCLEELSHHPKDGIHELKFLVVIADQRVAVVVVLIPRVYIFVHVPKQEVIEGKDQLGDEEVPDCF